MPNVAAACRVVGISRQLAYVRRAEDPEFRDSWVEAVDVSIDLMEQIAHRRATTGEARTVVSTRRRRELNAEGVLVVVAEETTETVETHVSDSLLVTMLKAHRPDRYRERVDHRHSGDQDNPVAIEAVYRRPHEERVKDLLRIAREQGLDVIEGTARPALPPADEAAGE